ncbi:3-deoxy-7-phosphoheptulonate synthase [Candidatus Vidania fulgoroideorum]
MYLPTRNDMKGDNKKKYIRKQRNAIQKILYGRSKRFIVVLGPCAINSIYYTKKYFGKILELMKKYRSRLKILCRVYLEKPRTLFGWKGFFYDSYMNEGDNIQKSIGRTVSLVKYLSIRLPIVTEFLSIILPLYIKDYVCVGCLGARNNESQIHRELCADMECPIGIKNSTSGDVISAINSIRSIGYKHNYITVDKKNTAIFKRALGNHCGFLIMRGGDGKPNISDEDIKKATDIMERSNIKPGFLIDASHDNAYKSIEGQKKAIERVIMIRKKYKKLIGVMIESYIRQGSTCDFRKRKNISMTDKCLSIKDTKVMLDMIFDSLADEYKRK